MGWMTFGAFKLLTISVIVSSAAANALTLEMDDQTLYKSVSVGQEFGRAFLKAKEINKIPKALVRAARSTAEFGGGTAYYLGEFAGKHLMATNAHVVVESFEELVSGIEKFNKNPKRGCRIFADDKDSEMKEVRFGLIDKRFNCKQIIGIWPEIDIAIFEIENAGGFSFKNMGISLNQSVSPYKGQDLAMFSFGSYLNTGEILFDLGYSQDQHCRVFSDTGDVRLMSDPDTESHGPVKVWSVAMGCDASWGDSGSAVVDYQTGKFVGLLWTGAFPKNPQINDHEVLANLMDESQSLNLSPKQKQQLIWNEMNYFVPAEVIRSVIKASINKKPAGFQRALSEMVK